MLVFVSSTFTDLAAEREHLASQVFPRLRAACESRGVVFGAVDLRWGVPANRQAAEEVVQICFDEIDRCRPFFVGLLGSRAGWSPGAVPRAILDDNIWLSDADRQTITELEFRYAAFHPTRATSHAWFYMSPLQSDDPRLVALRAELEARLPSRIRAGYASVAELGDWVCADFERLLDELYPEGAEDDPLDRERRLHHAYAATRSPFYVERGGELTTLDAHAHGSGPPLVVTGDSGVGKSALLATWVNLWMARGAEAPVISHFVGATPASGSWSATARRLVAELQRLGGYDEPIPDGGDSLRQALANWLSRAAADGRRVVLVIDAVNQLQDSEGARELRWLPRDQPPSLRLVVSTTQPPVVDELRRRGWAVLEVKPLSVEERTDVTTAYLRWRGKERRQGVVAPVAAATQARNPLFLVTLLDELCLLQEAELERRLQAYLQARTPGELFGQVLERHEAAFGRDLVAGAMSALWAARRGLSDLELVELLEVDWTKWIRYRHTAGRMLVDLGGLLSFGHQHVRDAVQERYVTPGTDVAQHARLARYFCSGVSPGLVERTPRRVDELPWQFLQAGDLEGLFEYLKSPSLFHATWVASAQDAKEYWAAVEVGGTRSKLGAYAEWVAHPQGREPQIMKSLADLMQHTTNPREAVPLREYLVTHYRGQAQQRGALARALGDLASLYGTQRDPMTALPLLEEELEICREIGDRREMARSLYNLGYIREAIGSAEEVRRLVSESARVRREIGDYHGLAESLGFLAYRRTQEAKPLLSEGKRAQATPLLEEAKRLLDEAQHYAGGDRALLISVHGTRGLVLRDLGEAPACVLQEYVAQKRNAEGLNDKRGIAIAIHSEATVRRSMGELEAAARLFQEEEDLSRGLGDVEGELAAQASRGEAMFLLGQREVGRALVVGAQAAALAGGRQNLVDAIRRLLLELGD